MGDSFPLISLSLYKGKENTQIETIDLRWQTNLMHRGCEMQSEMHQERFNLECLKIWSQYGNKCVLLSCVMLPFYAKHLLYVLCYS